MGELRLPPFDLQMINKKSAHFETIFAKKVAHFVPLRFLLDPFWPGPVFVESNMAQARPGPFFGIKNWSWMEKKTGPIRR